MRECGMQHSSIHSSEQALLSLVMTLFLYSPLFRPPLSVFFFMFLLNLSLLDLSKKQSVKINVKKTIGLRNNYYALSWNEKETRKIPLQPAENEQYSQRMYRIAKIDEMKGKNVCFIPYLQRSIIRVAISIQCWLPHWNGAAAVTVTSITLSCIGLGPVWVAWHRCRCIGPM